MSESVVGILSKHFRQDWPEGVAGVWSQPPGGRVHIEYKIDGSQRPLLALDNAPASQIPCEGWTVLLDTPTGPQRWVVAEVILHITAGATPAGSQTLWHQLGNPRIEVRLHQVGAVACGTQEEAA